MASTKEVGGPDRAKFIRHLGSLNPTDVFVIPVQGKYLIYAPLHGLTVLLNRVAMEYVRQGLETGCEIPGAVNEIVQQLRTPPMPAPTVKTGRLDPLFLGIIPTRGCNLGCRYCDFAAPKDSSPVMELGLARQAINSYFRLLQEAGSRHAEVHFFGGEPFFAAQVVHFAVEYAAHCASQIGLEVHFETSTNGFYNPRHCQWIAERFDTIVLSLDGQAEAQNRLRPAINGRDTFSTVTRSAKMISEGGAELILRACVTNETAAHMPEYARWAAEQFHPQAMCFETLVRSPAATAAGLAPPDAWEFARRFDEVADILDAYGIQALLSTADLRQLQASFCPVGKDALIVSPDGTVNACYLLPDDWKAKGLDMHLGRVNGQGFEIDLQALQHMRALSVYGRPQCANCFCRYHCAGGCHVHHDIAAPAGQYDSLCVQTRLVTISGLLRQLGQPALVKEWLADQPAMEAATRLASPIIPGRSIALTLSSPGRG